MRTGTALGLALLLAGANAGAETPGTAEGAATATNDFVAEHEAGKRAGRFTLGVLGGAVGGAAVGVGTVALTCAANPADGWCVLPGILFGSVLAVTVGVPLGAWTMGYLLDGDGSFVATLGGTVAGALAFYGIWSALQSGGVSDTEIWFGYAALALPALGAALAYELSSSASRRASRGHRAALLPMVRPGGGGLALAGAF